MTPDSPSSTNLIVGSAAQPGHRYAPLFFIAVILMVLFAVHNVSRALNPIPLPNFLNLPPSFFLESPDAERVGFDAEFSVTVPIVPERGGRVFFDAHTNEYRACELGSTTRMVAGEIGCWFNTGRGLSPANTISVEAFISDYCRKDREECGQIGANVDMPGWPAVESILFQPSRSGPFGIETYGNRKIQGWWLPADSKEVRDRWKSSYRTGMPSALDGRMRVAAAVPGVSDHSFEMVLAMSFLSLCCFLICVACSPKLGLSVALPSIGIGWFIYTHSLEFLQLGEGLIGSFMEFPFSGFLLSFGVYQGVFVPWLVFCYSIIGNLSGLQK